MRIVDKWKRYFTVITIGQAISMIGSSAVQFALIWWLAQTSGSPVVLGIAGFAAFIPSAVFGLPAGMLADRYNRKMICMAADMSIGVFSAVLALVMYLYGADMLFVFAVTFLRGVGETFHTPAYTAMTPQYVPEEYLMKVSGWQQMVMSASFLLGPVAGAFLYGVLPLELILLTDLVGAVFASGLLFIVPLSLPVPKRNEKKHLKRELAEGIEVFRNDRALGLLVMADALSMLFFLPLSSYYPLMTSSHFKLPALYGSIVETAFALGMMISAFILGNVLKIKRYLRASYLGLFGMGLTSLLCGILGQDMLMWVIFALLCGLMGVCANMYGIPVTVYVQTNVDNRKQGRAFSVFTLLASVAMPAGLAVTAPVAQFAGIRGLFFIAGAGILFISGLFFMIGRRYM